MPQDLAGDYSSALNDPVGAPEAGRAPQATLILDGDDVNASSALPGPRALLDWVDWLRRPTAKLLDYLNPLKAYRNARGNRRWGIDHMGFPAGQIIYNRSHWMFSTGITSSGQGGLVDGWQYYLSADTAGSIVPSNPSGPNGRLLAIQASNATGDRAVVRSVPFSTYHDDVQAVTEFWAELNPTTLGVHVAGFCDDLTGSPITTAKVAFVANETDANIQAVAGSETPVDTGIAKGSTIHRFRIEYYGANQDEAGSPVKRCRFYIDGALVADITGAGLLNTGDDIAVYFGAEAVSAASQSQMRIYSPVGYGANVSAGDVF